MTYLLPDDWYANHGLAPGDAKGPQPVFQPRPGNEMPVPIMRGYYGRPPIALLRTRSVALRPFMDTDVMWGVNGLGEEDINARVNKIFANMSEHMKKEMMIRAAAQTTAAVALSIAFPVVGTIVAAIAGTVSAIVGAKYQNEAKEVIADAKNKLQVMSAEYQQKMTDADNILIAALQPAAVELAASGQMLGSVGLGDIWSKAKDVVKKVLAAPANDIKHVIRKVGLTSVANEMERWEGQGQQVLDTVSGRSAVVDAREARDKALRAAQADFEKTYQEHVAGLANPQFQQNLVVQLARQLRADIGFQQVASDPGTASKGLMAAAGVTAAIVAFAAMGKH